MNCALFDLDGTLADTEVLKAKALSEAIRKLGGNSPPEIYQSVMGQSWEVVTAAFFRHSNLNSDLAKLNSVFKETYVSLIDSELEDRRHAASILKWFRSQHYKIGLVSSASPWMIEKTLEKLKLPVTFDTIVSSLDTKNHKPNPEAYLKALKDLEVDAQSAMAFEDSESGFQAASSAGIRVIGLRHSYNQLHNFKLCELTIHHFDEFLQKFGGSKI